MKKILLAIAATIAISTPAYAEINYDYKNSEHKADNTCVGVYSYARDLLFNEVEVQGDMVWLKTVEPTAEVVAARNAITDMQNNLILKYAYSKQFNNHAEAAKILFKNRVASKGVSFLENSIKECKNRG